MNLNVVFLSSIHWNYTWQRPQHICKKLGSKGAKILYIEPPYSLPAFMKYPGKVVKEFQLREVEKNVFAVSPIIFCPLRFKHFSVINDYLINQCILSNIRKLSLKDIIYYTCDPYYGNMLEYFNSRPLCFDFIDDFTSFPNAPAGIQKIQRKLLGRANVVLATAQGLFDKAKEINDKVYLVPNGTDIELFRTAGKKIPFDLEGIKRPIIGYVGAVAPWIDFDMIFNSATKNPDWSYVFVGPISTNIGESPSNVHFLGSKDFQSIPDYVASFDVCMIPFKVNDLTLNTNPVKLYEYLSVGKPVVSTNLPEVLKYREVATVITGADEFSDAVKRLLFNDSEGLVKKRIRIAEENSWDHRVDYIESVLRELTKPIYKNNKML